MDILNAEDRKKIEESGSFVSLIEWARYAETHTDEEADQWAKEHGQKLKDFIKTKKQCKIE